MNKFVFSVMSITIGFMTVTASADDFFSQQSAPYLQMTAEELEQAQLDSNALWELFNQSDNINLDISVRRPGKRPNRMASGQVLRGRDLQCFFKQISELKKINWDRQRISKKSNLALFAIVLDLYETSGKAFHSSVMANRNDNGLLTSVTVFIEADPSTCRISSRTDIADQL